MFWLKSTPVEEFGGGLRFNVFLNVIDSRSYYRNLFLKILIYSSALSSGSSKIFISLYPTGNTLTAKISE